MQTQSPSPLPSWWAQWIDAIRLCGLLNVISLILTTVGTYLAVKGRKDIRKAREIAGSARQSLLIQIASSEFGECRQNAELLFVHLGNKSWPISQHISSALSDKLTLAKAFQTELRGINRDLLDVSVRTASQLREYLTTTTDSDAEKIQKGQRECRYLATLLGDIHGSLRFRRPEEII